MFKLRLDPHTITVSARSAKYIISRHLVWALDFLCPARL